MKSNKVYKLYNEDLKSEFIQKYGKTTQKQVTRLLSKCYDMESKLNKDFSSFEFSEVRDFLLSLNKKSIHSLYTTISFLRSYVDFAIEKQKLCSRTNCLNCFKGTQTLEQYINNVAENLVDSEGDIELGKYITRQELYNIINFCVNPQDGALFGVLFEGATLEEARNLLIKDCDFENSKITFTKDNGITRTRTINDHFIMNILKDAIKQERYEKNNGLNEGLRTPSFILIKTEYVFRASGKTKADKIQASTLNNRLKKIASTYGNPFLNPTNLWISGIIDFAKKLKAKLGVEKLQTNHYQFINKEYGYNESYWSVTKMKIKNYI
ncbi:phage integrase family [Gottschalkia purinilytica]|uniref:Phage integrase family n=1 Tax=Gottschalkia purinilytica TaxID=1503 RepID=A0A0L0WB01_GOTPU|nr:hypothetical protein [Gottschalkia purinilytica]KNF08673.1 phage integrase family [Gottschalkia purinilytica]